MTLCSSKSWWFLHLIRDETAWHNTSHSGTNSQMTAPLPPSPPTAPLPLHRDHHLQYTTVIVPNKNQGKTNYITKVVINYLKPRLFYHYLHVPCSYCCHYHHQIQLTFWSSHTCWQYLQVDDLFSYLLPRRKLHILGILNLHQPAS